MFFKEKKLLLLKWVGRPAVKISAYETINRSNRLGLMAGQATIPDDLGEWTDEEAKILGITE